MAKLVDKEHLVMKKEIDVLMIRDYYPSYDKPTRSTWVYNQTKSLVQMGYNPFVISPSPVVPCKKLLGKKSVRYNQSSLIIEEYHGTQVIRPPFFKIPNNYFVRLNNKNLSKCILQAGKGYKPKLIHAHFGQNGAASLALKNELGVPLVTSFYGYDSGRLADKFKPIYSDLIEQGDLFLALSEDMKNDLLNMGFPNAKIVIHHLGVDVKSFGSKKHDLFTDEVTQLLTVANFDETKGIHIVIDAVAKLINTYPEYKNKIRYNIVGGGSFEPFVLDAIQKHGLEDIVAIINNIGKKNGREIVEEQMGKADIFLLCSYVTKEGGKEGTPVVLMEAQAAGLPCVATRHAGIPEVVIDKHTGILVDEKNADQIVDALFYMLKDKEATKLKAIHALEHINNNFNHAIQMDRLVNIYERLTESINNNLY